MYQPLADLLRPETLDDVVGQEHILGKGAVLRRLIESGKIPNMVFYGPSGTVPVFDFRRNIDAVARLHLDCLFAFFLIVTAACHADKDLSAAILCMMDVPVIAAARFKSYIENANLTG